MNVKWILPIPLCAAVLYLSACSTSAPNQADPLADVPAPSEVRFISADDATSKCIGNPNTPLCAVETILACFARADLHLCKRMGITDVHLEPQDQTSKYTVIAAHVLTEEDMKREDIAKEFPTAPEWWKPGFVDFTIFKMDGGDKACSIKYCSFDHMAASGNECCYHSYIANPEGQEWRVISWSWWGDS